MVQYSQDLPEIYQNFKAVAGVEESEMARLGSSVTLADFCPYIQVAIEEDFFNFNSSGRIKHVGENKDFLEEYPCFRITII